MNELGSSRSYVAFGAVPAAMAQAISVRDDRGVERAGGGEAAPEHGGEAGGVGAADRDGERDAAFEGLADRLSQQALSG